MSALARFYRDKGKSVLGYDRIESSLTRNLQEEGIFIFFIDGHQQLDAFGLTVSPKNTLVIYTPAIPLDSKLFQYFKEAGFDMIKRAKALGEITADTINISIAGTHGKTTTSCLVSHLFTVGKLSSVSILGGIAANTNSNYSNNVLPNQPHRSITEADEFDRSFLQLSPTTAVITSMDADHLDIYHTAQNLENSFLDFARCLKPNGRLYVQESLQSALTKAGIAHTTYGIERGQVCAKHVHLHENEYVFDLYHNNEVIRHLKLGIQGRHNVENAVVAAAIALDYGISEEDLRQGLLSFKGVKRRFEYVFKKPFVYIDDYAHHPTELNATIGSVREMYKNEHITGIFQPHLYSRTRDFAEEFAHSLSALDTVLLLDIYPARELPIEGITSEIILSDIVGPKKLLIKIDQVIDFIAGNTPDVLLTLGAGDIDRLVPIIQSTFNQISSDE